MRKHIHMHWQRCKFAVPVADPLKRCIMAHADMRPWSDLGDWAAEDALDEVKITILTYG